MKITTAEGYVNNQTTVKESVTVSPDGKSMTIELSANVDQMDVWKDTENTVHTKGHWYLIVLDTGMTEAAYANGSGTTQIAVTAGNSHPTEDDKLPAKDVGYAKIYDPSIEVGVPFWVNMDMLLNGGKVCPVRFWLKPQNVSDWSDVEEPYMTINIVGGTVTGTAAA